jgi:hypothetical protein
MSRKVRAASAVADESPGKTTLVYKEPNATPAQEDIAKLAYALWQARGCPDGSSEQDWLRAEAELTAAPSAAKE